MCHRYHIKPSFDELAEFYEAFPIGEWSAKGDIFPKRLTPGLVLNEDGERELHPMQFGMSPADCPTPADPKRSYNNTRIESITWKPWKLKTKDIDFFAVRDFRCVLPISEFYEPCYWGETAGTEVYFSPEDGQLLHAAGIYRLWRSRTVEDGQPKERQLYTMSLLMRPACEYVMERGHHRQPLFIGEAGIDAWIRREPYTKDEALSTLRMLAHSPALQYRHARDLKSTWLDNQSAKLEERDKQVAALESATHACGF